MDKEPDVLDAVISNPDTFGARKLRIPFTTEEYWDCECEKDYIHSRFDRKCPKCGARREDQPNARVVEVLSAGLTMSNLECIVI